MQLETAALGNEGEFIGFHIWLSVQWTGLRLNYCFVCIRDLVLQMLLIDILKVFLRILSKGQFDLFAFGLFQWTRVSQGQLSRMTYRSDMDRVMLYPSLLLVNGASWGTNIPVATINGIRNGRDEYKYAFCVEIVYLSFSFFFIEIFKSNKECSQRHASMYIWRHD